MSQSQTDTSELENKLETVAAEVEALETLQEEIKTCGGIGDTILSGLFHEARTDSGQHWKKVTAFCNIEDGELVVDHTDKLSDGRWAPQTRKAHDVLISVRVQPFMSTEEFKHKVESDLQQAIQGRAQTKADLNRQLSRMDA